MADIMNFWFLSSRPVPIAFRYPSPSSLWYQPSPQSLYDLFLAEQLAEAVIDVDTEERTTPPRRGASLPASGIVHNAKHTSLALSAPRLAHRKRGSACRRFGRARPRCKVAHLSPASPQFLASQGFTV